MRNEEAEEEEENSQPLIFRDKSRKRERRRRRLPLRRTLGNRRISNRKTKCETESPIMKIRNPIFPREQTIPKE